jgi:hypothetical protein
MNATDVQQALGRFLYDLRHSPVCGNFKTSTLPECDLISINRVGLLCEFEIKISRSDFRADFSKTRKHENLAQGNGRLVRGTRNGKIRHYFLTCSYFTYACPAGLLTEADLPPYAGLVWVHADGRVQVLRAAPVRHLYPADGDILRRIAHNLTQKFLYGCSRMTFASRAGKTKPVPRPTESTLLGAASPGLLPSGRRVRGRDPVPVRRRRA